MKGATKRLQQYRWIVLVALSSAPFQRKQINTYRTERRCRQGSGARARRNGLDKCLRRVASTVCLIALGYAVITYGQQNSSPAVYNPYPPGILPADLDSEVARVLREVDVIEGRAIERWHSLPAPTRLEMRPGPTRTEGTDAMGEGLAQLAAQGPAGRPATADEIAEAIVFLAADRASFIYGAKLPVDGGRTAI